MYIVYKILDMDNKNITEQESLQIILSMMEKTKQRLTDNSKYFLMWGIAVIVCALLQYALLKNLQSGTQRVWLLMPIMAIIHLILSYRDRKKEKVVTHNKNSINAIWLSLGIGFVVLTFLSFNISFDFFPFLILFMGIGTFATGRILAFKPLIYGGLVCFIASILTALVEGPEKLLLLALAVFVSYIIPAIILRRNYLNRSNL